jgi:hypothetical protein
MKKRVGLNAKEEIYMESRMNSKSFLKKKKVRTSLKRKRATILNEKRECEKFFVFITKSK